MTSEWREPIPGDLASRVGRLLNVKGAITDGFALRSDVIPILVLESLQDATAVVAQQYKTASGVLTAIDDAAQIFVPDGEAWSIEQVGCVHAGVATPTILDQIYVIRSGISEVIDTNPKNGVPSISLSGFMVNFHRPFMLIEGDSVVAQRKQGAVASSTRISVWYRLVTP
jgi:hypothetical protein